MVIGVASQAGNMKWQDIQNSKQHDRQKELMGMQNQAQWKMNQQGYDLSKRFWDETNYKQQVEKMKEAGLNPSLMYGKGGGAGGQSVGMSGGNAASGDAKHAPYMDMNALMMGAQMDLMAAQGEKARSEANAIDTYRKDNTEANTTYQNAQSELAGVQKKNIEIKNTTDFARAMSEIQLNNAKFREAIANAQTTDEIRDAKVEGQIQANLESVQRILESKSDIKLNDRKIKYMTEQIVQKWKEIKQTDERIINESVALNQNQDKIDIMRDQNRINEKFNDERSLEITLKRELEDALGWANIDQRKVEMWVNAGVKSISALMSLLKFGPKMGTGSRQQNGAMGQRSPY